jgi:hypothetical protein
MAPQDDTYNWARYNMHILGTNLCAFSYADAKWHVATRAEMETIRIQQDLHQSVEVKCSGRDFLFPYSGGYPCTWTSESGPSDTAWAWTWEGWLLLPKSTTGITNGCHAICVKSP